LHCSDTTVHFVVAIQLAEHESKNNGSSGGNIVMQHEIDELITAIREGIRKRGFYLLMDDRLELIARGDEAQKFPAIQDFAKQHGWAAKQEDGGVLFHNLPNESAEAGLGEIMGDSGGPDVSFGLNIPRFLAGG
jgi:hypothetical protein